MSQIIERVEQNKQRLAPKLREELARKPLSRLLRRESWPDHERAQYSPFEVALAEGTIPREAYADLLVQVLPVYRALEERGEALRDDPMAGRVFFPELLRADKVERDIVFYLSEGWQAGATLLPVTIEYVERVRGGTALQFIAHHYNRYLADLSGGLMIASALKRAWDLNGDGLLYYDFPEIADPAEWKQNYRAVLDGLPLDVEGKLDLIGEVMVSYEYNIVMADDLARKHLEPAGA
ncbi:MAG: heme oxygenase (biliverdin-producing) [Actinomycetota bacterium]